MAIVRIPVMRVGKLDTDRLDMGKLDMGKLPAVRHRMHHLVRLRERLVMPLRERLCRRLLRVRTPN